MLQLLLPWLKLRLTAWSDATTATARTDTTAAAAQADATAAIALADATGYGCYCPG